MSCIADDLDAPDDATGSRVDLEVLARLLGELVTADSELEPLCAQIRTVLGAVVSGSDAGGSGGSVLGDGPLADAFRVGFDATAGRANHDLTAARAQMADHVAAMRGLGQGLSRADADLVPEIRNC